MNRRGVALVSTAHVADDFYQGAVPALLPFLVAERHYTYAAVSGLTLAATFLSSVAQPAFGWLTDRRPRRWLIPGGMGLAALGVALAGLMPSYPLTWVVIALSGLGVAAFHPDAARAARQASGDSNRAMSIFALGGNVGYALGALVTTPVLVWAGLHGTPILLAPAAVMIVVLVLRLGPVLDGPMGRRARLGAAGVADEWPAFLRLTAAVVIRSIIFFGITSFLALYLIARLHASHVVGGTALTVFLVAGALGTLAGGWLADRTSALMSIRVGFALAGPAIAGVVLAGNLAVAFVFVALSGIALYVPFAVFVVLGQDYLPNRIGTASGVTVGLAVSIGGLFNPIFGAIADATSLRTSLAIVMVLPVLGLLVSLTLREPAVRRRRTPPAPGPAEPPPDAVERE
ncbi:MFS transporter [Intrasporangium sp.]|uniref:MFS transporter n=1 Tax=Intrasporangium sp. TaxID=1925024 RepID=UPI003221A31B